MKSQLILPNKNRHQRLPDSRGEVRRTDHRKQSRYVTISHNQQDHIRSMIHWQLHLEDHVRLLILHHQGSKMNMSFRDQEEDCQECQASRLVTLETEIYIRQVSVRTTRCGWVQVEVGFAVVVVCIRLLTTLCSRVKVVKVAITPWHLLAQDTIQSAPVMARQV